MLSRLYSWYGKTVVNGIIAAIILLLAIGLFFTLKGRTPDAPSEATTVRSVEVRAAGNLGFGNTTEIIGTVEAINEAELMSEVGGRITRVPVTLGERISAGSVIAEIENSSERAVVLQAQGSYEAALASAAQSNTGVATAEVSLNGAYNAGLNSYRTSLITAEGVIRSTIDTLFSNPTGATPGFRLDALGQAVEFNERRKNLEVLLREWSETVASNPDSQDVDDLLREAEGDLQTIANFIQDIYIVASREQNDNRSIGGESIDTVRENLTAARTSIDTAFQDVREKRTAIENALNALESAEIGGTGSDVSAADAQVKQALGSLRAAEANLAKTIVRAPFPGTINTLNVKVGDAVSPNTSIARIANNNALEITAYLNEVERNFVELGESVMIDETQSGNITHIAPAIDPATGKIEIRIGIEGTSDMQNGDTVSVSLQDEESTDNNKEARPLTLPLRSLKMTPEGPVVFTVDSEDRLISNAVDLGAVTGDSVVVLSGITRNTKIVADARGLKEGAKVTVIGSKSQ